MKFLRRYASDDVRVIEVYEVNYPMLKSKLGPVLYYDNSLGPAACFLWDDGLNEPLDDDARALVVEELLKR